VSRYYEGRWNPYNRHDTGMYVVYRQSDDKYLGVVQNCRTESEAKRKGSYAFGCEVYVSEIEE